MKHIYKILIITLITLTNNLDLNAQIINNNLNTFTGTWENQSGNEIFRVILWLDTDSSIILGHYEKVTVDSNGNETYIYCSDKDKYIGNNNAWRHSVIGLVSVDNQNIGGSFIDNTVNGNLYSKQKTGRLHIELISSNNGNITARWIVKRNQGIIVNDAPEYSVPTDIILTKVE